MFNQGLDIFQPFYIIDMYVTFYINKADPNVIDKSNKITKVVQLSNVQIPDTFNVRDFVMIMSKYDYEDNAKMSNYVYLEHLFRYYFITNVVYDGDFAKIHLKCDVLYTFKQYILNDVSGGYITSARTRPNTPYGLRTSGETIHFDDTEVTKFQTDFFEGDYTEFTTENPTTVLIALKGNSSTNI